MGEGGEGEGRGGEGRGGDGGGETCDAGTYICHTSIRKIKQSVA